MIRQANIVDIPRLIDLLHQVDMVHHRLRPDLFKPNTTKYSEQELALLLTNETKPIFVYDEGDVLGYAFCQITEVKDDRLLQDRKTLYIDDLCVDEANRRVITFPHVERDSMATYQLGIVAHEIK